MIIRPRPRPRLHIAAVAIVAGTVLVVAAGCSGDNSDATCAEPKLSLRVLAGPGSDSALVEGDASSIEPGSQVEAAGAHFVAECDTDSPKPIEGLSLAVVEGDVDLNVAGVAADGDGNFVVTFGLPENLPAGPAKIVARGPDGADDLLASTSFDVVAST